MIVLRIGIELVVVDANMGVRVAGVEGGLEYGGEEGGGGGEGDGGTAGEVELEDGEVAEVELGFGGAEDEVDEEDDEEDDDDEGEDAAEDTEVEFATGMVVISVVVAFGGHGG